MNGRQTTRDVSARAAIECIRGPMTNAQVMEKFKISPAGYVDLLKQLFAKKLITEEDLNRRGIRVKTPQTRAAEKPLEAAPVPVTPPEPKFPEDHDEFLDTITLTELLTFKPKATPGAAGETEESGTPLLADDSSSESSKKGKFSFTGLFWK